MEMTLENDLRWAVESQLRFNQMVKDLVRAKLDGFKQNPPSFEEFVRFYVQVPGLGIYHFDSILEGMQIPNDAIFPYHYLIPVSKVVRAICDKDCRDSLKIARRMCPQGV
jgi:hypothetical protein